MSGPEVAIVFPDLHRRGGVERLTWDLLEYLAPRHDTAFVGTTAPEGLPAGAQRVTVPGPAEPGPVGMWVPSGPDRKGAAVAGGEDHGVHGGGGAAR